MKLNWTQSNTWSLKKIQRITKAENSSKNFQLRVNIFLTQIQKRATRPFHGAPQPQVDEGMPNGKISIEKNN